MSDYAEHATTGTKDVGGILWRCWKVGIAKYEWRDKTGLLRAGDYGLRTYYAAVDGKILKGRNTHRVMRFRSIEAAMREAVARAER